ncbi:polymorphic toxin-type HINT domain-containing protein [Streptomyces sp. NPDC097619]|uniref:polymorphic toxin-type HINT domain-containing protein n=1 Tax=Streptomyces sp. NPDC097619 TaxID=3157228 RepID=UPI0033313703
MADRATTVGNGIDGALLTVKAPPSGAVPLTMELSYAAYADLYGADWASRLRLVQLPECFLTTPDVEACREYEELETENDTASESVRATIDVAADGTVPSVAPSAAQNADSGVVQASFVRPTGLAPGGDQGVIAALDSGTGAGGSFKATPLISSGQWSAGSSSGAFTWSYPVAVPPAPAGPGPEIALGYNSQTVDGKTASTSPQASWVGEGWDYDPGHIERRYRPCKDDVKAVDGKSPNNTAKKDKRDDLCWVSHNATMSFGGKTMELVRQGDSNRYRPTADDGTLVELKTNTVNGDNNGEHWVVTTPDGTKYFYGLNKIGGGHSDTNSVFTAPVFGNHPGEPCYATTFASSRCNSDTTKQQAWHWGLDKVIDVHGNVMIINWRQEKNFYAVNKKSSKPEEYVRGGQPDSIEYGLREGALSATPSAKVDFVLAERCLDGATACAPANFHKTEDAAAYRPWRDTPGNLNCKSTSKLCPFFPSFWTQYRLNKISTFGHRPGSTGLQPVDTYVLNHAFPRDLYSTSPGLWLSSIDRYGYTAGSTKAVPLSNGGTGFTPYQVGPTDPLKHLKDRRLPNLVPRSTNDARPMFAQPRIGAVTTEHGGEISVTYTGGCKVQPTVSPEDNRGTCYPVRWSPDGEEKLPQIAWFNKYLVDTVVETDRITGFSDRVVTKYAYKDASWGRSDDEFTRADLRTPSVWRGYQTVTTTKGGEYQSSKSTDPETQSHSVTRYFRGAGGAVKDSTGKVTLVAEDAPQFGGMVAESVQYSGAGGRILSRTLNKPWSVQTASRARDGGAGPLLAHRTGIAQTDTIQTVGASWQAVRETTTVDDTYGLPVQTEKAVVKPNGTGETLSDFSCTKTEYVHNADPQVHLIGLAKSVRTTTTSCADHGSADPSKELVGAVRTSYDGLGYGATPTQGLPTSTAEINGDGTAYSIVTTSEYDPLGRIRKVTKPVVGSTQTQYTPGDAGGPLTSVKTINPMGHTSTTTLDPGRGLSLSTTDTNGRVSRSEYDAFGRLVKGWSPDRSAGTQTADVEISYQAAYASSKANRPASVTTRTLKDDGTRAVQITLYDGLMRPVQTQTQAHGPGRIIADTKYDDHGLVREQTSSYLAQDEPSTTLFVRLSPTLVPSLTRTFYDGLERPVRVATYHSGKFLHNATTTYGDTTTYIRPPGISEPARKTYTDALGRTTKIQHFTNTSSTLARTTSYEYDGRGNLAKVIDPAGSTWAYEYDARNRVVGTTDPDTGATTTAYDDADRPKVVTDARGGVYTEYDKLGRVVKVRQGSATADPSQSFAYDSLPGAIGLPVSSTRHDPGGDYVDRVTGYDQGYRPTGRETVIPANTATTGLSGTYTYAYAYTTTGKPHSVTLPAKGGLAAEKVVTRYNEDGLPESTAGADWYTADVTYSPYGEVMRTVSGPQPHRVWTTNFLQDNTRQLHRRVVDRETSNAHRVTDQRYSYDHAGLITSFGQKLTDGATSVNDNQCFTYDAMGELVHAWTSSKPSAAGGAACQSPGGWSWGYRTDGVASRGPVADAADSVSDTTSPDTALSDSLKAAAPQPGTIATGSTAYWDSYTFDVLGNRATLVTHNTADASKDVTSSYKYGTLRQGNGTTPPYLDQPHVLTEVSSTPTGSSSTYVSDAYGNTTKRALPGRTQNLTWSRENKLATITDKGITTKYVYDADGNRILEYTPTSSTLYVGETELIAEGGRITKATRSYAHAGAPTIVRSTTDGATTGHKLDALITDHLGTATTTVAITSGQTIGRRAFKPYGDIRGPKPTSWPNQRTYLGVGIDDSTGLTHIGAREYDSETGRFISADPIMDLTDPLQINGYAYSHNSPITRSDPSGLIDDGQYYNNRNTQTGGYYGTEKQRQEKQYRQNLARFWYHQAVKLHQAGRPYVRKLSGRQGAKIQRKYDFNGSAKGKIAMKMWQYGAPEEAINEVTGDVCGFADCATDEGAMERIIGLFTQSTKDVSSPLSEDLESTVRETVEGGLSGVGAGAKVGGRAAINRFLKKNCNNCFPAGTQVKMADGSTKPIEKVRLDDKVAATDPETGESGARSVTRLIITDGDRHFNKISIATQNGASDITATHEHPFWSPSQRGWIEASDLQPGMTLLTDQGRQVRVTTNTPFKKTTRTYNLTVDDLHTYYVLAGTTPILVHNSNGDLTPEQLKSIGSYRQLIEEHEAKLRDYLANPDAYDNKGFLKNAPNEEVRQRIIEGRARHLRKEIRTFHENIAKITGSAC